MGGMVSQWLALLPHSEKVKVGSVPGLVVGSLHALHM